MIQPAEPIKIRTNPVDLEVKFWKCFSSETYCRGRTAGGSMRDTCMYLKWDPKQVQHKADFSFVKSQATENFLVVLAERKEASWLYILQANYKSISLWMDFLFCLFSFQLIFFNIQPCFSSLAPDIQFIHYYDLLKV